jgi:hypothetical protein
VPDWWRALHFPNIDSTGTTTNDQSCASCDPDNDRYNNAQEFIAQTDPFDGRYAPRVFAVERDNLDFRVGFVSALGQKFAVDRCDDLVAANWVTLTTNLWGKTDTTTFLDPGALDATNRFYRVRSLP